MVTRPSAASTFKASRKGRAADAVFLGDLELVDPAAGLQLAAEYALPKQFGNFFVQGARRERKGGHGRDQRGEERREQIGWIVSREEYFASIIMNDIKYASFLSPPTHAQS